jgi:hypothetical protein
MGQNKLRLPMEYVLNIIERRCISHLPGNANGHFTLG